MHLRNVAIYNFRSITDFRVEFTDGANLLIGPNAVGKTTVLEAIRLAKGVLAPRTGNESRQVLTALGAISSQLPQNFNYSAIAGDVNAPIKIECSFELDTSEIAILPTIASTLARYMVAAQQGISLLNEGQLALVQYLSSAQGQTALLEASVAVGQKIRNTEASKILNLSLTIEPNGSYRGEDLFAQSLFAQMEGRLSPAKTMFSYFPADRAMPSGDAVIQLGAADAQQQVESHNSNASLKYQRLKSTIFSSFLEGEESRNEQGKVFELIFSQLLKEKKLEGLTVNQYGQANILISDIQSQKKFDIDSLSSGEKGLILTFLLIWRSVNEGGTLLIDEPELHLNSAVCKDLLSFLIDNFLKPKNIQAVICTHSPEVIASAMRSDDATVFHLKKGIPVASIRKQDQPELVQALRLLGTSEIEELLYEGIVFVEGEDDVELLELAFPEIRSRFKFKFLQGRGEVEKLIRELQKAEKDGTKDTISYFMFDNDGKLTSLTPSPKVRIKQWDRYCLENYLIEPDVLFDVVTTEYKTDKFPSGRGDAINLFSRIANKQLMAVVIEDVYKGYAFDSLGVRGADKRESTFEAAASATFDRIEIVQTQITSLNRSSWTSDFLGKCEASLKQREQEWSNSWQTKCSGKQFLIDLRQECGLKVSISTLKRRLLQESKLSPNGGTESWKLLNAAVKDVLNL